VREWEERDFHSVSRVGCELCDGMQLRCVWCVRAHVCMYVCLHVRIMCREGKHTRGGRVFCIIRICIVFVFLTPATRDRCGGRKRDGGSCVLAVHLALGCAQYLTLKAKNSFLATRRHGVVGSRRGCHHQLSHSPAVAQAAPRGRG
jgi:hypothetical protein